MPVRISLASSTMGSGQVLARISHQLTLPPSISEPNYYFFLGKANFFFSHSSFH